MSIQTVLTITHAETANQIKEYCFGQSTSTPRVFLEKFMNYLNGINGGVRNAQIDVQVNGGTTGVKASGTVTFSAAPSNNDTVTINSVAFTAKTSGATGNQFNIGTVSVTAANLAAAINASATSGIVGVVSATSALGVVTVTCANFGVIGNLIPLAKSGANIAVSAANLASGANTTANTFLYAL